MFLTLFPEIRFCRLCSFTSPARTGREQTMLPHWDLPFFSCLDRAYRKALQFIASVKIWGLMRNIPIKICCQPRLSICCIGSNFTWIFLCFVRTHPLFSMICSISWVSLSRVLKGSPFAGQYIGVETSVFLDWRLFTDSFSHTGVSMREPLF